MKCFAALSHNVHFHIDQIDEGKPNYTHKNRVKALFVRHSRGFSRRILPATRVNTIVYTDRASNSAPGAKTTIRRRR